MAIKILFGLQQNHIEQIESKIKYWDDSRTEEDKETLKDGWIMFDYGFWKDMGELLGWDSLTLALKYFKYREEKTLK